MKASYTLYRRLLSYVRPYWRLFALAIFGMAVTAATEPLFPALLKPLLDGHFNHVTTRDIYFFPLAIIGIFLVRGTAGFIADYSLNGVSMRVVTDLRNAMFDRLLRLPTHVFDNQSAGILMSKIVYDVSGVTGAATNVLTVAVRDTLTILGLLGWLLYLNWQLTLITLTIFPFIVWVIKVFSGRLRDMARGSQQAMGTLMQVLEEATGAHKVIKIFGGQHYEAKRFNQANTLLRGYAMRQTIAQGLFVPIVQLFAAIALAIVVTVALLQSVHHQTTVGSFVSFIITMLMLLTPIKRLTDVNAPLQRGLAAAESVFQLIDEPPEVDQGTQHLDRAQGAIQFKNVNFTYRGANRAALNDIDLNIAPGEIIALVGSSGSGKTTLANLLPRFYQAYTGSLLIDGTDVKEFTLASLRANIALVSQDVVLFNDTVAANIAYGLVSPASHADIEAAAQAAYALAFIQAMPQGFDTLVGENGVKLSGGQRQRLAIARALLKNTPILILDEATSALDSASERHVQAALETLMKNRTTLVIAHRLSTIEKADRIIVLEQGQIVESGCHAVLMAKQGVYARLHQIQYSLENQHHAS